MLTFYKTNLKSFVQIFPQKLCRIKNEITLSDDNFIKQKNINVLVKLEPDLKYYTLYLNDENCYKNPEAIHYLEAILWVSRS